MGSYNIPFPWVTPRRKTLAPDGSYRDSPFISDAGGYTGQGQLIDDSYTQDPQPQPQPQPTIDQHSNNYSDNPPPIKPTESEASPTTAQTNPTWAAGDRTPAGPPGYTPMASPPKPLYEGMAQPQAYTDYQNAIKDPRLNPHTSTLRQVLGGLVSNVASGMLSPLGDTVRYGAQGAQGLRDARHQLTVANEARQAQLAQDRESQTAANQALLRKQAEDQIRNSAWLRQQEINRGMQGDYDKANNTWQGNMQRAGAMPMPEGASLEAPSTGYVPPAAPVAPAIPPRQPIVGPVDQSQSQPQPQGGSDISSLPTRTFNPGAYLTPQMQVPRGYGTSMPPAAPKMQPSGRLSMIPPRESQGMMIPPRAVADQQKLEAQGKEVISTPADYVDQYGPTITRDQLSKAITANREPKGEKKDDTYWLNVEADPTASPELKRQAKAYLNAKIAQTQASRPIIQNQIQGMPPATNTTSGEDYLKALPPGIRGQIQQIVNGDAQLPSGSTRSVAAQQLRAAVFQADPNYNEQRFKVKGQYKDQKNGTPGGSINSANTLIDHIGVLDNLATALANHDTRGVNAVVNYVQRQLGHPEVTDVNTALTAVSNEAERLFRQSGTSETGIAAWHKAVDAINSSPAQAKGQIKTVIKILGGRTTELANSFRRGMERKDAEGKSISAHPADEQFIGGFFSPQARTTLQKMGIDPDSMLGATGVSGGSSGSGGTTHYVVNGKGYTIPNSEKKAFLEDHPGALEK